MDFQIESVRRFNSSRRRGLGFGDIRSFPDLYKCGNGLTAYSSNALDALKRIHGG